MMLTSTVVVAFQVAETEKEMLESIHLFPCKLNSSPSIDVSTKEYEMTSDIALAPCCAKNSTFPLITLRGALEKAKQDTVPLHLPSYRGFTICGSKVSLNSL